MPDFVSSISNNLDLVVASNFDFTGQGGVADTMVSNGQLIIGTTALNAGGTHCNIGNITSSSLTVGFSSPNITIETAGGGTPMETFTLDNSTAPGVNPVVADGSGNITITGGQVANASLANVIQTHSYAENSYAVTIQRSASNATTDSTKNGVSHFDSAAFDVDANGFVQLNGGGIAATSFDVQANTAPGTDPVVPTAAGAVTINGAAVANHSVVLETRSRAANAYNIEVQYSGSAAATDATKSGVAHFDSDIFTVDADGFVSTSGGTLVQSITGGPGITITGTAAVPIVNSVVFTDTTATTLAVDQGYFATAAGTYNMPATAAQGEVIEIVCDTAGAVVLDCPALNFIRIGSLITSSGGTATSTLQGDALKLRYRASALTWECISVVGTWLIA